MLSSSPQRLSLIESTGVAALDRRPFGDLNFDERKLASDPEYRQRYMQAEEKFLEEIVSFAESAYLKLSTEFDHELKDRIPMIVYKTHAEFEQTNIIVGFTRPCRCCTVCHASCGKCFS